MDPRDCVAVEDSPAGIASAVAAGCGVVALRTPATANERGAALLARCRAVRDDLMDGAPFFGGEVVVP